MSRTLLTLSILATFVAGAVGCQRDDVDPPAPAGTPLGVFDPAQGALQRLSEYPFFAGALRELEPAAGVLPYDLINPLFTDYAKKVRHLWLPSGAQATWNGEGRVLEFPDGAVLLKTFYYDGVLPTQERRIVETRMMYRWQGEWLFANYVWNEEQTEAFLDLSGSYTSISWVDDGGTQRQVDYRIPALQECRTCHRTDEQPAPIGPKPRNLARTYPYADGEADQLVRWMEVGYLEPSLPAIEALPDWHDASVDLQDRARAYVDINCAHCHNEGSYCSYRPMRFAWEETVDPVNLGLCVIPEDPIEPSQSHIVSASRPERSMMVHRIASTAVAVRMPLLGRTLVDEEGLALIEAWIASLDPPCP